MFKNKPNVHSIPVLGKLFVPLEPQRRVRSRPGHSAASIGGDPSLLPSREEPAGRFPLLSSPGTEALPLAGAEQRRTGTDVLLCGGVSYYQFNPDPKHKPCIPCGILSRSLACQVAWLGL